MLIGLSTDIVSVTWQAIGSQISYGTTSYTDNATTTGYLYLYNVRYINGCGDYTATATSSWISDGAGQTPTVSQTAAAVDRSDCLYTGIDVSWPQDPSDWGDNNEGIRTYDVLREGSPLSTGIAYGTTSYNDSTGINGTTYRYQVRYNNGCGLSSTTTGTSSNDRPLAPGPLDNNSAVDNDSCSIDGNDITWSIDLDNTAWGDASVGTRTYTILRDGTPIVTGLAEAISHYTDDTASEGVSYTYTVRYVNGCGLYTDTSPGADATDDLDDSPCGAVSDSVTIAKAGTDASIDWIAVVCGDLDGYRVYGCATLDGTTLQNFPVGWDMLGTPTSCNHLDSLGSSYLVYKVVSVDQCGNSSL